MKHRFLFSLLIGCWTASCLDAAAADFYLAPSGSDANPGSASQPFATIARARDAVREWKLHHPGQTESRVILRNGEYRLNQTLVLAPEDSGTRYITAENEKPVVTSAVDIKGWRPLEQDNPVVTPSAKGHVWVAQITTGWRFHFLYVDGRPARRSRSTEQENWRWWGGPRFTFGTPTPSGQLVTFQDKAQLQNLPGNGDVEMFCILYQFGVEGNGVLTDIDAKAGTALWHSNQLYLETARGGFETDFRLENALAYIRQPGEWAVDSKAGKVYYWPREGEDMNSVRVTAPALNELVRLQGDDSRHSYVSHVNFEGITFTCTDRLPEDQWPDTWTFRQWENPDAMIFAVGTEDCSFLNCRFYYSGSYGIALYRHALRDEVTRCEIGWAGSGGVELFGRGAGFLDDNHDNVVTRNYIHDQGLANYWHSPNIQIFGSGHNTIAYNFLAMSAYNNISITGLPPEILNDWQGFQKGRLAGGLATALDFCVDFSTYPKDVLAQVKAGKPYFNLDNSRELAVHSRDNLILRNVCVECHSRLEEGGALYAWYPGKGNQYIENVIYKSQGMPGSSIISMDDRSEYAVIIGNVVWIEGGSLCIIGQRDYTQGTLIKNNVRACYKPEWRSRLYERPEWWKNEADHDSFDALYKTIADQVKHSGGWPGDPHIDAWIEKLRNSKNHFELTPEQIKRMNTVM